MVGAERFELPTLWSQTRCATRLRYAPTDIYNNDIVRYLKIVLGKKRWSEQRDSNSRPSGPKPDALPGCAMLRKWLLELDSNQ
jgi:hypothetical protein